MLQRPMIDSPPVSFAFAGMITREEFSNTDRSTTRYDWAKITRTAQTEGLTLAFYSERNAFFFPRSFFDSDPAWTGFATAVAAYVSK